MSLTCVLSPSALCHSVPSNRLIVVSSPAVSPRCCSCPSLSLTFRRGVWLSTHRSWFMCLYLHKYLSTSCVSHVLNPKLLKITRLFDDLRLNSYIKCLEMEKIFLLMTRLSSLWRDERQYITESAHGHEHDAFKQQCWDCLQLCAFLTSANSSQRDCQARAYWSMWSAHPADPVQSHFSLQIYKDHSDSSRFLV